MPFRIIGNERQRGLDWAIPRLEAGAGVHWDDASALILEKDGDITAVAVYNRYYPANSVELSIASLGRNWLTRPFLAAVFRTPFLEWNLRRVTSSIAEDNTKSIRFCEHIGFRREGCLRQAAPNGNDLLLYGLLKSECRFLGNNYVEGIASRCAGPASDYRGANGLESVHGHGERQS